MKQKLKILDNYVEIKYQRKLNKRKKYTDREQNEWVEKITCIVAAKQQLQETKWNHT